jgi:hypothetical protein
MRVDGVFYGNQNASDPSLPVEPQQTISLIDFTLSPPVNTWSDRSFLLDQPQCWTGPVTGYFIPSPTFLHDSNAVFAGVREVDGAQVSRECRTDVVQLIGCFAYAGTVVDGDRVHPRDSSHVLLQPERHRRRWLHRLGPSKHRASHRGHHALLQLPPDPRPTELLCRLK